MRDHQILSYICKNALNYEYVERDSANLRGIDYYPKSYNADELDPTIVRFEMETYEIRYI